MRKRFTIRSLPDIKERYRAVIAQVALRTIHEILISTPGSVIELVTFYGKVSAKDPATGQPVQPLLLQVSAQREVFSTFVLSDLDPVACLRRLNALVSPHPYDLEPVKPTVDFESLLTQFKFVAGMDVVAGMDSRPDLLAMAPTSLSTSCGRSSRKWACRPGTRRRSRTTASMPSRSPGRPDQPPETATALMTAGARQRNHMMTSISRHRGVRGMPDAGGAP